MRIMYVCVEVCTSVQAARGGSGVVFATDGIRKDQFNECKGARAIGASISWERGELSACRDSNQGQGREGEEEGRNEIAEAGGKYK